MKFHLKESLNHTFYEIKQKRKHFLFLKNKPCIFTNEIYFVQKRKREMLYNCIPIKIRRLFYIKLPKSTLKSRCLTQQK